MNLPATLDSTHVQVMRRIGPPQTCYSCAHADCERRRREARIPCALCEARILPDEEYRVLVQIGGGGCISDSPQVRTGGEGTPTMKCDLPLNDPSQWPLLMTKTEVAWVRRRSIRTIDRMVEAGTFPEPTSMGWWPRTEIEEYLKGGVRKWDRDRKKAQLRMVGSGR
jgi:predicted DNA-binding transcriptional regulator AlpA